MRTRDSTSPAMAPCNSSSAAWQSSYSGTSKAEIRLPSAFFSPALAAAASQRVPFRLPLGCSP
jgi:hypothetical protein